MAVFFAEFGYLRRYYKLAVDLLRVGGEVVLMVVFGGVEGTEGLEFGDDGGGPELAGGNVGDDGLGLDLLVGGVVEDGRAVLRADIGALTIGGGGVVDGEEDFEQVGVADGGRIKGDLDGLSVAGKPGAHLLIGRIGAITADVAGNDAADAFDALVYSLQAPEAAAAKGSLLELKICVHDAIIRKSDKNCINL